MQKIQIAVFLVLITLSQAYLRQQQDNQSYAEYMKELAQEINKNSEKLNWQANEDVSAFEGFTKDQFDKERLGAKSSVGKPDKQYNIPIINDYKVADNIPESFDAREQWPECESIKEIRNQSSCGSCWAFGGVEAFSDRWCIATDQKEQVKMSSENLLSCCEQCGMGCHGGYNPMVWNYFQFTGVVTGDLYGDNSYCQPYSIPPNGSHRFTNTRNPSQNGEYKTPSCKYKCNPDFKESYKSNLYFTKSSGLIINKNVEAIQTEIMTNGPVEVLFEVFDDFKAYKSGVYKHTGGGVGGGHAVKMLGWGVENGEPYWLCANSWGYEWGDGGFFKILRGQDECGIEHEITFGQPDLQRNRQ